jgi:hypothetical protein
VVTTRLVLLSSMNRNRNRDIFPRMTISIVFKAAWPRVSFLRVKSLDFLSISHYSRKDVIRSKLHAACLSNEYTMLQLCRFQWPRDLRRGSAAARLLGLRAGIPLGAWMPFSCERCLLSRKVLCFGLITWPEESYCMQCV